MDALLVIDLQNGVNSDAFPLYQLDKMINGVNDHITYYRQHNKPIIFVQHNDNNELIKVSYEWELFSELNYQENDYYVNKTHANSFYHTKLKDLLDELQVDALEICGAQTEYCVDATIKMAHGLGYPVTIFSGLTTTNDAGLFTAAEKIVHYEQIWKGRFAKMIE